MGIKEAQRLRDLEKENTELKKLLADQIGRGDLNWSTCKVQTAG
jgi:hypothetical protein